MTIVTIILLIALIAGVIFLFIDNRRLTASLADTIRTNDVSEINQCGGVETPPDGYDYKKELLIPVLAEIGAHPHDNEDGDILFDYQGLSFVLKSPGTSPMIRLVLPEILTLDTSDPNLPKIIEACNTVGYSQWGAKPQWYVRPDEDTGKLQYHFFVFSDQIFSHNVPHPVDLMKSLIGCFINVMDELRVSVRAIAGEINIPDPGWNIDNSTTFSQEQMN